MPTSSHDILIIGGGMVGTALACALAKHTSLSIAVLEAQAAIQPWSETHYSHRVSAIALSSMRIFQGLQVWDAIKQKRVSPFTGIAVWDASSKGEIQFNATDIGEAFLGFIIENNVMQQALTEKMHKLPQIDFIAPVQLEICDVKESHVELTARDGHVYQGKLAIAADGAHSWLREQTGISVKVHDYEQEALVTTVTTALPHERIARQVFLSTGPLAFLPLAEPATSSIVWSLPVAEARRLKSETNAEFLYALTQAFSERLGDVLTTEDRYTFPLRSQQANHYIKPRIALVGDAGHTIHPLAGQGVNMGLLDAASLLDVIVEAEKKHRDFASLPTLRQYERWRKADNLAMLKGVDLIKQLFASEQASLQGLRAMGLNLTNKLQCIKNLFTRNAVGNREGLPTLAL